MENETRNKKGNRFLSTLAAGVIGSVLTLGVVTNTNLIPMKEQVEKPVIRERIIT